MSRADLKRRSRLKHRAILAFGESLNDTRSLRELVSALRPDLPPVYPRERPIILRHGTQAYKLEAHALAIEKLISAENVRAKVVAIIAHRDLDNTEPTEGSTVENLSEAALALSLRQVRESGVAVIPTVPAWELEAWWFMWPDQVAQHRAGWRRLPDRTGKRVDLIRDAKATLIAELEPRGGKRCPRYSETDSPLIAARIKQDAAIRLPKGKSHAFERFTNAIDSLLR